MGHVLLVNMCTDLTLAILFVVAAFWQDDMSNDIDSLINSFLYGSMYFKIVFNLLILFFSFQMSHISFKLQISNVSNISPDRFP